MPGNGVRLPVFPAIYWGVYHLEWTLYPLAGLIPRPHDTLKHKPGIKTGWNMLGYEMNYNIVFFCSSISCKEKLQAILIHHQNVYVRSCPPHTQFQSLTHNSETINYLETYLGKQKPTYFDCTQSPMHTPLYNIINLHTPSIQTIYLCILVPVLV